jgi:hypothetical protein
LFNGAATDLEFIPVVVSGAVAATEVRTLQREDGSNADPAIASHLAPTAIITSDDAGAIIEVSSQTLRRLTSADVAAIPLPAGVLSIRPYAFTVLRPTDVFSQFDGLVTFGYSIPKQARRIDDPRTISFLFLIVNRGA